MSDSYIRYKLTKIAIVKLAKNKNTLEKILWVVYMPLLKLIFYVCFLIELLKYQLFTII